MGSISAEGGVQKPYVQRSGTEFRKLADHCDLGARRDWLAFENVYHIQGVLNALDSFAHNSLESEVAITFYPALIPLRPQTFEVVAPNFKPMLHLSFENIPRPKLIYSSIDSNDMPGYGHRRSQLPEVPCKTLG